MPRIDQITSTSKISNQEKNEISKEELQDAVKKCEQETNENEWREQDQETTKSRLIRASTRDRSPTRPSRLRQRKTNKKRARAEHETKKKRARIAPQSTTQQSSNGWALIPCKMASERWWKGRTRTREREKKSDEIYCCKMCNQRKWVFNYCLYSN